MTRRTTAVDALMAEYVNWGGPIITRAEAYRSAVAEGITGPQLDYVIFSRTAVPAPEDPAEQLEFHRRVEAMRAAERDEQPQPTVRTITLELVAADPREYRSVLRSHRPVSFKEWTAIERKWSKPRRPAKGCPRPVGYVPGSAPADRLADGRTVAEALDARTAAAWQCFDCNGRYYFGPLTSHAVEHGRAAVAS